MIRENKKFDKLIQVREAVKEFGYFKEFDYYFSNKENTEIKNVMMKESNKAYSSYKKIYNKIKNNPEDVSVDDTEVDKIKDFILSQDIHDVAFTKLEEKTVLDLQGQQDFPILLDNMIVITKKMDKDVINNIPSPEALTEFLNTYCSLDITVNKIVDYINSLGYLAHARDASGGEINYTLAGQIAGLGHIGKHGLLISPGVGPAQRINVVLTNIDNLNTLNKHEDHSWIESFCDRCNKCVNACPAGAIYEERTDKYIDYKKCVKSFSKSYACGVCMKVCPFNSIDYYRIKNNFIRGKNE